jgi:4-amino-4-deoxychorismate lyase
MNTGITVGRPEKPAASRLSSPERDLVEPKTAQSWSWSAGAFVPGQSLPVTDRGFRYGMSVFETLRILNGTPDFLEPHLDRLRAAALQCGFSPPSDALSSLPALLNRLQGTGVARVYITAGDGAPDAPAEECRVVVLFEPRSPSLPATYGVRICPTPHLPPFGGLKTANYWSNLEALRQARLLGAHECLLFRPDGRLTGAAMANVFVKTPAGWLTPTLNCGARSGVLRAWTLAHLAVREAPVTRERLSEATSIFLTSSWLGLMQVDSLDGNSLVLDAEISRLSPL